MPDGIVVPDWIRREFERGYAPTDSPPGFEERCYDAWKASGGRASVECVKEMYDKRGLHDLLVWLEYGRHGGYRAARCSQAQGHHWADLLRELLRRKT